MKTSLILSLVPLALCDSSFCKLDKESQISAACDITFRDLSELNLGLRDQLQNVVHSDFFRYFKLDLYKQCPFWDDNNGYCMNRACAVDVCEDWESLPEYWQPEVLGQLEGSTRQDKDEMKLLDELCGKPSDDGEYCNDLSDFTNPDAVLVDLSANPERFTGYGGQQSSQIWSSIYNENCFAQEGEACLAKDAFYRLVSGLHASIAIHLTNDYLNTETGEWGPNLDLFMARVGNFPDRVANVYFNYAVVGKSLWKIAPMLEELPFCAAYDQELKANISDIVGSLGTQWFNEDLIFENDERFVLKDDFRTRFKNVTKIMDCVHCDRCRMWGKVQTTGYATALKILFENEPNLTKFELIALFQTFDRLSKSLWAIDNFEKMYKKQNETFGFHNWFKKLQKVTESVSRAKQVETKTSEAVFQDLKMPKGGVVVNENVFVEAWHTEVNNVIEAFRFLYKSYLDFPLNLFYHFLSELNKQFNKFIGVKNYATEEDKSENIYTIDLS